MDMKSSHTLSRQSAQAAAQHDLPVPAERRRIRELWGLTPQQVGVAFGVRAATVRSWESGRTTPTGKRREAYRRFLQGLAQRTDLQPRATSLPASRRPETALRPRPAPLVGDAPEMRPAEPARAAETRSAARGGVAEPALRHAGEAPASGWLPRLGTAAVVISAWGLALVLLDAYLPGWTG